MDVDQTVRLCCAAGEREHQKSTRVPPAEVEYILSSEDDDNLTVSNTQSSSTQVQVKVLYWFCALECVSVQCAARFFFSAHHHINQCVIVCHYFFLVLAK